MINAENASLKSQKFTVPNDKARLYILKGLIETGLDANYHHHQARHNHHHGGERPKSAGAASMATRHHSFKTTPILLEQQQQTSLTPDLPPIPSISRSNVLRENIKSLTRRKSSGQQYHNTTTSVVSLLKTTQELNSSNINELNIINEEQSSQHNGK